MWLEGAIAAHPVASIDGLHHLDPDVVFPAPLLSLPEILKATIGAAVGTDVAIALVTFVEHESVLTILAATGLGGADTFGDLPRLRALPQTCSVPDKDIYHTHDPSMPSLQSDRADLLFCFFFHSSGLG